MLYGAVLLLHYPLGAHHIADIPRRLDLAFLVTRWFLALSPLLYGIASIGPRRVGASGLLIGDILRAPLLSAKGNSVKAVHISSDNTDMRILISAP